MPHLVVQLRASPELLIRLRMGVSLMGVATLVWAVVGQRAWIILKRLSLSYVALLSLSCLVSCSLFLLLNRLIFCFS